MKSFPYVCDCGFNTMDPRHANEHVQQYISEGRSYVYRHGTMPDRKEASWQVKPAHIDLFLHGAQLEIDAINAGLSV